MFAETLADFMDAATGFAEAVTIGGVSGAAIFDLPTVNEFGLMANTEPVLTVVAADFPAMAIGNAVTARSVSYTITALLPDGTGMTRVLLK